jgi:hypothetical protein
MKHQVPLNVGISQLAQELFISLSNRVLLLVVVTSWPDYSEQWKVILTSLNSACDIFLLAFVSFRLP